MTKINYIAKPDSGIQDIDMLPLIKAFFSSRYYIYMTPKFPKVTIKGLLNIQLSLN
jgi:hypothetical protein